MNIFKTIITLATAASLFLLPAGGGVEANALSSLSTTSTTALVRTSATSLLLLPRGGGIHALPSLSTTTSTTALAIRTTLSLSSSFNLGKVEAACPDQCKSDGICGEGDAGTYNGSCCRKLNNKQCAFLVNACQSKSISVGCNSCIGAQSCDNADRAVIGRDSCHDYPPTLEHKACERAKDANIGNAACHGHEACNWAERANIANGACHGNKACQLSTDVVIGTDSCLGYESCQSSNDANIGNGACHEDDACAGAGHANIANGACHGREACVGAGHANIANEACHGWGACGSANDANIGNGACHGQWTCRSADHSNITDGACHEHMACQLLDYYYVGPRACKGKYACYIPELYPLRERGFNESKDDFITNNDGVCSDGSRPSYDIPENTCVGDGACYRCKNYLGCLGPNRCNVNVSNGDIDSTNDDIVNGYNRQVPPGEATCRLCRPGAEMELNIEAKSIDGYTKYPTGGCIGQNELFEGNLPFLDCADKCSADENCKSFEYEKKGSWCTNSNSCTSSIGDQNDKYDLFVKNEYVTSRRNLQGTEVETPFSCEAVVKFMQEKHDYPFFKGLRDEFSNDLNTIQYEAVNTDDGQCKVKITIPPRPDQNPDKDLTCELETTVLELLEKHDSLTKLQANHPKVFQWVTDIVPSLSEDCKVKHPTNHPTTHEPSLDERSKSPKKKSKGKKRGKGTKKSKNDKQNKKLFS